jgi:hypothetical protein
MDASRLRSAGVAATAVAMLALVLGTSGCESYVPRKRDRVLTQAEHDSILARQREIPGTVVVARALEQKERNARKNAEFNARFDSLTGVRGR